MIDVETATPQSGTTQSRSRPWFYLNPVLVAVVSAATLHVVVHFFRQANQATLPDGYRVQDWPSNWLMQTLGLENEYEVLVTMDADISHQPAQLPPLLEAISEHDFVIGTRSNGGGCDYTGVRKFLSLAGNRAARLMIPTGLTEYTTSMRAFTPEALQILFTQGIRDDGYAFFMETVEILYRSGCAMTEVPIHFMDRTHGQSKIPKHQIWLSASTLVRLSASRLTSSL